MLTSPCAAAVIDTAQSPPGRSSPPLEDHFTKPPLRYAAETVPCAQP